MQVYRLHSRQPHHLLSLQGQQEDIGTAFLSESSSTKTLWTSVVDYCWDCSRCLSTNHIGICRVDCLSRPEIEAPFRDSSTIRLVRSIVGLYKYEVQYFCYYPPMHSLRVRVLRWTVCPAMVERKLHTFFMVR
jgi:hypothetical protein